ncbi:Cupredoxin [Lipomyces oligophaga]|uniref:Cupredoxin n=1 Tax=Lipomyces oligophaga TaxID=45792 RepID=UPI0034D01216
MNRRRLFRPATVRVLVIFVILVVLLTVLSLVSSEENHDLRQQLELDSDCTGSCHLNDRKKLVSVFSERQPAIRKFDFTAEYHVGAGPDGAIKQMSLINGVFPGPTLYANKGDTMVIRLHNRLNESTSLHFHGIHHYGSNEMDGVPGVTQCGVPPGHSFEYRFKLDQSGTFWWHSHSYTQRIDGMAGAFIVQDRENDSYLIGRDYDEDVVVLLQDYYHAPGEDRFAYYLSRTAAGFEPVPENGLINGHAWENICSRAHHLTPCETMAKDNPFEFQFVRGRKYRLRFINIAALAEFSISLDRHVLTVIEADTSDVMPIDVHYIPIAPGQRYSAIITAEPRRESSDSVLLRAEMNTACFNYPNVVLDPEVKAIVNLVTHDVSISHRWDDILDPTACVDLDSQYLKPVTAMIDGVRQISKVPDFDERMHIHTKTLKLERVDLAPFGFINRTSHLSAIGAPNLHVQLGLVDALTETVAVPTVGGKPNTEFWGGDNLIANVGLGQVIELVIHNPDESAHPFHLHGFEMYLVRTHSARIGVGAWKEDYANLYNLTDVVPRDTITVPRLGHAVVRFVADHPGFWAFHCHILWHLRAGMMMQFAVGVEHLQHDMVNQVMKDHCKIERDLGSALLKPLPGYQYRDGMIPA